MTRYRVAPAAELDQFGSRWNTGIVGAIARHVDRIGVTDVETAARRAGVPERLAKAALEVLRSEGFVVAVIDGDRDPIG